MKNKKILPYKVATPYTQKRGAAPELLHTHTSSLSLTNDKKTPVAMKVEIRLVVAGEFSLDESWEEIKAMSREEVENPDGMIGRQFKKYPFFDDITEITVKHLCLLDEDGEIQDEYDLYK